jgi:serine/threonine-protein kinase HipA
VPPAPLRKFNQTIQLEKLQNLAEALIKDELPNDPAAPQVQELLLLGTSMGGARPKAVIEDQNALWIAKFNRPDDRWNNTRVEHAMLRLARECGISTAESRMETVGGKDVLLIKRFDRETVEEGYLRARMVSALTILRAEDSPQQRDRWSYVLLAEEVRRIVAEPRKDAQELFRRMCFNAMISNLDDHPRNHAVIANDKDEDKHWKLSPAYDLPPSPVIARDRRDLAMESGDLGRYANVRNLLSQHVRFLLEKEEAEKTLNEMAVQAGKWYDVVRACGLSQQDAETIRSAFLYPGLFY